MANERKKAAPTWRRKKSERQLGEFGAKDPSDERVWLRENREAIAGYNALVETHGVFSDDWRRF